MRRDERAESVPTSREDRVLDQLLRFLQETEPLDDRVVDAAVDAYVWRTVDAELLDLLVDSRDGELELVRDEEAARVMAFGRDDRGVHFECIPEAQGFVLEGAIQPPLAGIVVLQRPSETVSARMDALGTFRIGPVAPGTVRLVVNDGNGQPMMVTPWFVLG